MVHNLSALECVHVWMYSRVICRKWTVVVNESEKDRKSERARGSVEKWWFMVLDLFNVPRQQQQRRQQQLQERIERKWDFLQQYRSDYSIDITYSLSSEKDCYFRDADGVSFVSQIAIVSWHHILRCSGTWSTFALSQMKIVISSQCYMWYAVKNFPLPPGSSVSREYREKINTRILHAIFE